jgi:N-methylhydantoinase A/acetone carboxylase beta subunit
MATEQTHDPELLALDTGGTMTDTFIVDDEAGYTVGKAQTTPDDEANGVVESFADALGYWDVSKSDGAETLRGTVYSGTAMINRLLEREGSSDIGVITTAGTEDTHQFGRGLQSWAHLSYEGRLHAREHHHPEPLVPRENIKGVRGRIHTTGQEVFPLYEDEAREVVEDLLDKDVRVICVCTLHSHKNPAHEQQIKEIAEEVKDERNDDTPVWLSSDQNPIGGELPRLNSLILEAYAVEPSRKQLHSIRETLQEEGSDAPFRVLSASGGTISPDHDWLVDTMISGPIGGVFGGEYVSEKLGISNLVCSDVGGTSFDVALITKGHYPTRWDTVLSQFIVNIPMTSMDTIGSGTGSYVRLEQASERLQVGPDSAGYLVGVSNEESGLETPTVTDCTAMLGYLNDEYFLGGDIPLNVDRAKDVFTDQIADPLDEDPYEAARGVLDTVERDMTNELRAMVLGQGYSPENYTLISYGGGGPLHTAGYTRDLDFQDVLVPEWAAAFSAFGAACSDYAYRFDKTVDLLVVPGRENLSDIAEQLTDSLLGLREEIEDAFRADEVDADEMNYQPSVSVQYAGMQEDLEVQIPDHLWDDGLDADALDELLDRYEEEFSQVFRRAAQSPEQGYLIKLAIGQGVVDSPKPTIPEESLTDSDTPPEAASRGEREIYWDGDWHTASLWEMGEVEAGNVIEGPGIVEAPATTFLVPPGFEAPLDEHRIYHLTEVDQ